jgi:hypothetical protein
VVVEPLKPLRTGWLGRRLPKTSACRSSHVIVGALNELGDDAVALALPALILPPLRGALVARDPERLSDRVGQLLDQDLVEEVRPLLGPRQAVHKAGEPHVEEIALRLCDGLLVRAEPSRSGQVSGRR